MSMSGSVKAKRLPSASQMRSVSPMPMPMPMATDYRTRVTSVWRKRTMSRSATVMANSDSLRAECFRDRYTRKATP